MYILTILIGTIALAGGTVIGYLFGRQTEKTAASSRLLEESRERSAAETRAATAEARERSLSIRLESVEVDLRKATADARRFEVEAQR